MGDSQIELNLCAECAIVYLCQHLKKLVAIFSSVFRIGKRRYVLAVAIRFDRSPYVSTVLNLSRPFSICLDRSQFVSAVRNLSRPLAICLDRWQFVSAVGNLSRPSAICLGRSLFVLAVGHVFWSTAIFIVA